MEVNTLAIVQARMNSTRLPGKVLKKINDRTLIEILLQRLSKSKSIDKIILATSKSDSNDILEKKVIKLGYEVFRGSEENVLERFYQAAKAQKAKTVIRITGDCPIIDPFLTDDVIKLYQKNEVDYVSNVDPPTFPDGLDVEVFSFKALETAQKLATTTYEREHVTPFIRNNKDFKRLSLSCEKNYSSERWTVDDPEDFEVITKVIHHFKPNLNFLWEEVIKLKESNPEYFLANKNIKRNEGSVLGRGQKLYRRAKKLIPGGTMLLSKRPEMFLPKQWPVYFSKAKGCEVWDLDNKNYIDMSIMGIGTNILGYGQEDVDNAVRQVIDKGNMSTFNCPEEVLFAEKLVELHPWSEMIRLARSGGEANSIAIRIARAACGKDKVAICGYHGWNDWYLAANLSDNENLKNHLLPGLDPIGVPKALAGTVYPFNYNDIQGLKEIISSNDIGIIKMEVSRSVEPREGFLEKVRQIASENNIILIFDECTSGFRETFGGLHKKYGVDPDMAVFGKAMGNGYALTACIGRREVMESAQKTFISSTFWTERIGPTAGLKTFEIMEREKSWEYITNKGKLIGAGWIKIAKSHGIPININGLPALINFSIESKNWIKYKTFITQEMLKKGFLASNVVYVCMGHTDNIIDKYFNEIDKIFSIISRCEQGENIDDYLEGPICHDGFKRLN